MAMTYRDINNAESAENVKSDAKVLISQPETNSDGKEVNSLRKATLGEFGEAMQKSGMLDDTNARLDALEKLTATHDEQLNGFYFDLDENDALTATRDEDYSGGGSTIATPSVIYCGSVDVTPTTESEILALSPHTIRTFTIAAGIYCICCKTEIVRVRDRNLLDVTDTFVQTTVDDYYVYTFAHETTIAMEFTVEFE